MKKYRIRNGKIILNGDWFIRSPRQKNSPATSGSHVAQYHQACGRQPNISKSSLIPYSTYILHGIRFWEKATRAAVILELLKSATFKGELVRKCCNVFWRIICRPEAYILVRREVLKNLDCFWLLCKAFYGHLYLRKIQHNFMFWSIFIGIKYFLLCLSSTIN